MVKIEYIEDATDLIETKPEISIEERKEKINKLLDLKGFLRCSGDDKSRPMLSTEIHKASATIDPANVAADDILVIGIQRDVATDDLVGNGQLFGILLEYTSVNYAI